MTVSVAERLDHILDAIAQVKTSTAPLVFEEFEQDRLLRWGVERGLEIISEATRSIPSDLKTSTPISHGAESQTSATGIAMPTMMWIA